MNATTQTCDGTTDAPTFDDIAIPTPQDDRVVVAIHAAGLDMGVWHRTSDQPPATTRNAPATPSTRRDLTSSQPGNGLPTGVSAQKTDERCRRSFPQPAEDPQRAQHGTGLPSSAGGRESAPRPAPSPRATGDG